MICVMETKEILRGSVFIALLSCLNTFAFAQTNSDIPDQDIISSDTVWYLQPWAWAVVVALIILCIAYYSKNNERKNLDEGTEKGLH